MDPDPQLYHIILSCKSAIGFSVYQSGVSRYQGRWLGCHNPSDGVGIYIDVGLCVCLVEYGNGTVGQP